MAFEWRPHRGGLDESMAEKRTFETWDDFIMFLRDDWSRWYAEPRNVKVKPYAYDDRINWDTWIVSGEIHYKVGGEPEVERAVFGWTNGDPRAEAQDEAGRVRG